MRVVSPWFGSMDTGDAFFSKDIPLEKADALICEWAPSSELFSFSRRKAWYCCEPWALTRNFHGGIWPSVRARLAPSEFLCHNHSDERYRVPHHTHYEPLTANMRDDRVRKAVAVVSNHGGSPWRRNPGIAYRNRFVTNHLVDLFGRRDWLAYRSRRFGPTRPPSNYKGEIAGTTPLPDKLRLMSDYIANVCMENVNEPYYFTEKFVEAARAGCVPVYRAHSTNARVLEGAVWIDPADHDDDPEATIRAALEANDTEIRERNAAWLAESRPLAETSHFEVFKRIAQILAST